MSLYYGYDDGTTTRTQHDRMNYNFNYQGVLDTYIEPMWLRQGYPVTYIDRKLLNEDSYLTILHHTFDDDGSISSDFGIKYKFVAIMKDGTRSEVEMDDISDMGSRLVPGVRSIYVIDYTARISSIVSNYSEIAVFFLAYKRTAGTTSGNESILSMDVVF